MSWNYRNRFAAVLLALVSLLFAQFAVAGYVCPAMGSGSGQVSSLGNADMPCAGSMGNAVDDQQPSLCHAYCNGGHQSVGDHQPPGIAALTDLSAGLPAPRTLPPPLGESQQTTHLKRTTAPPLTVRHCCFRI